MEKFSKFNGTYPSLGNSNSLPEIVKCCGTEPNILSNIEVFSNTTRKAIHIDCSVCNRQSFKIYLPTENKSIAPSEIQIRYWNWNSKK